MLVFNLKRVLALRGIEKPAAFMLKNGINRQTANNLLYQRTSVVKIEHVEMFCRELNCTPNDLFEWRSGGANALPESHSLNHLKRNQTAQSIREMIKDVPLEKVESLIKEQ
jgi:DNA-binding Xre family transcriptional regulator